MLIFNILPFGFYKLTLGMTFLFGLFIFPIALVFSLGKRTISNKEKSSIVPLVLAGLLIVGMIAFITFSVAGLGWGVSTGEEDERELFRTFAYLALAPAFSYIALGLSLLFTRLKKRDKIAEI